MDVARDDPEAERERFIRWSLSQMNPALSPDDKIKVAESKFHRSVQ